MRVYDFAASTPLGPYILDFYCDAAKLAVEIDGWSHNMGDQAVKDAQRDKWLAQRGVTVVRFSATEVLKNMESVVATILAMSRH